MPYYNHGSGRRLTLRERLQRLNDGLAGLGRRLRESIANVIGSTVADAASDAVRMLLDQGSPSGEATDEGYGPRSRTNHSDRFGERHSEYERSGWHNESDEESPEDRADHGLWSERHDEEAESEPKPAAQERTAGRLGYALTTAVAAGAWWLQKHKPRRPILTALVVAVAAGVTAFLSGPAAAAGLGVVSSVGGLLMTVDAVGNTTDGLATFAAD